MPLEFSVPLGTLLPGKYTCQVNVIDEVGKKFAFARAPMVLLGAEARAPRPKPVETAVKPPAE